MDAAIFISSVFTHFVQIIFSSIPAWICHVLSFTSITRYSDVNGSNEMGENEQQKPFNHIDLVGVLVVAASASHSNSFCVGIGAQSDGIARPYVSTSRLYKKFKKIM